MWSSAPDHAGGVSRLCQGRDAEVGTRGARGQYRPGLSDRLTVLRHKLLKPVIPAEHAGLRPATESRNRAINVVRLCTPAVVYRLPAPLAAFGPAPRSLAAHHVGAPD